MRERIYSLLVNRITGIRERYVSFNKTSKSRRILAFLYLLWLNVRYYLLFDKSLEDSLFFPLYESKKLPCVPESSLFKRIPPDELAEKLSQFDIISFDVFDTLIFRVFSSPTDVFKLIGIKLKYPNFEYIRIECEKEARKKKFLSCGTYEVTLEEIWDEVSLQTSIKKELGIKTELESEKASCFANPYMLKTVNALLNMGKKLIVISDMYLNCDYVKELLYSCGYGAFDGYFVSCDLQKSKHDGTIYSFLFKDEKDVKIAHVGDNIHSDINSAKKYGITPFYYKNINSLSNKLRSYDLSALTGSIYRGIVNSRIYNGLYSFSFEYEYGFIYGGLFTAGYCKFIKECADKFHADKILFLSRDGDLLIRAYKMMYPDDKNIEYVYWSRLAALKLTASRFKSEYFNRFLFDRVSERKKVSYVITSMELECMLNDMCLALNISKDDILTNKTAQKIKQYLLEHFESVIKLYSPQVDAAKRYFSQLLSGCKHVIAVDIGWAGSGAVMLNYAVNELFNIPCRVTGTVAGTLSRSALNSDSWDMFLNSGEVLSYMYSHYQNRDIWKKHDHTKNHNLYFELLLGSSGKSLKGFYPNSHGGYCLKFKEGKSDSEKIDEIHSGALDFVESYLKVALRTGINIPISGRDAYAPMINVFSKKNRRFTERLDELTDDIQIT